ncbi:hypothetical protein ABT336_22815, partial [Micromonospora sp. NPDC000207]
MSADPYAIAAPTDAGDRRRPPRPPMGRPGEPRTDLPVPGPGHPHRSDPAGPGRAGAGIGRASERGGRLVAVAIAAAWHVAIGLPAVLSGWSTLTAPLVVGGGWLVAAGAGAFAAGRLLTGGTLPVRRLAVLLLALDVAVFAASGSTHLFTTANWVWSTLGWFFVLVCWGRPVTGLAVLLGAHSAVALGALLAYGATEPADLARYAMYAYGTASLPLAISFGSATITSLARERAEAAAAALAATAER